MKKVFMVVQLILVIYLLIANFMLKSKVDFYAERSDEFHENLYARVDNRSNDSGAHILSISDVYYRKYFISKDDQEN